MLVGHSKVAFPLWSWHPDAELREERIKSSIGNCGWGSCPFIQRPKGESGHTVVTVQGDYEAIRIGVVGVIAISRQVAKPVLCPTIQWRLAPLRNCTLTDYSSRGKNVFSIGLWLPNADL